MSEKTKRRLAIAGASVICIALVVAIGMRFAKEPAKPDASSQEPVSTSDVAPDIQNSTEKKEVVVSPQPTPESNTSETLPSQTDLPEQKLQLDPLKSLNCPRMQIPPTHPSRRNIRQRIRKRSRHLQRVYRKATAACRALITYRTAVPIR